MAESKKTDNHNLPAKLELRRYFLRKYHSAPLSVLDCCQATGRIWSALRDEFATTDYWGVDLKPHKGRLKIDSVRILDQPGWTQNVIDIDAYGSPWKHYFALLRNCRHDVTVFLTIGMVKIGGGNYDNALLSVLGLDLKTLELPNSLGARLIDVALQHALCAPSSHGLRPVEAMEAPGDGNARYIGIRLQKPRINAV
jgi:hypothetical protein